MSPPGRPKGEYRSAQHEGTPVSTSPLLFQREGALVRLTLNRPDALNALDVPMARALALVAAELAADQSVRCVVLQGAGRGFCAGGDLLKLKVDPVPVARELIDALHAAIVALCTMRAPLLASVHGVVAGAGMSLLLACDLAVAAEGTRFNLAYVNIGASCDGSSSWSLPRVVGLRKALEIVMLGETLDAAEALRLGLVNRVVPAGELEAQTGALALRLAEGPTQAFGEVKRLLRDSLHTSLREQLDAEAAAFLRCAATQDFVAGLEAFVAKRAPRYVGR
jgi:2-(1,2-epoxy-1,2-dihydrophenyl)acetyl-CoA isomerase